MGGQILRMEDELDATGSADRGASAAGLSADHFPQGATAHPGECRRGGALLLRVNAVELREGISNIWGKGGLLSPDSDAHPACHSPKCRCLLELPLEVLRSSDESVYRLFDKEALLQPARHTASRRPFIFCRTNPPAPLRGGTTGDATAYSSWILRAGSFVTGRSGRGGESSFWGRCSVVGRLFCRARRSTRSKPCTASPN